jgi:S1-C subfamily serine protease
MRIPVSCLSCSHEFTASEAAIGKRVKCPACGEGVRVTEEADEVVEKPRRSSGSGRKAKGRAAPAGNPSSLFIGLAAGAGAVIVLAIGFLMMNGRGNQPATLPVTPPGAQQPAVAQSLTPAGNPGSAPGSASPGPAPGLTAPGLGGPGLGGPGMQPAMGLPGQQVAGNVPNPTTAAPVAPQNPSTPANNTPSVAPSKPVAVANEPRVEMDMKDLVKRIEKSVVRIIVKSDQGASIGSGFVIDSDGSIMTNYHVIEGANSAEVEFENGEKATVIGFTTIDTERDIAIIRIEKDPATLHGVRVANTLPEKGEKVAAFGAPRGLSFTASDGIISAIRATPEFSAREKGIYLQTTTPISPGNSGGPLVNMFGEIVGVNSFKMEGENLNFAVSATDIRDVIANRGTEVTPISPTSLKRVFTEKNPFSRAENLAGTERGTLLFGRIRDAVIMMLPFAVDPSGNVSAFVEREVAKNLITKAKWTEITRREQVKKSTAVVVVLIYFTADPKKSPNALELMCKIQIVARDVDKEGLDFTAIVYDEHKSLGKISPNSLVDGNIPNGMKQKIPEFFSKIVQDFRKAQKTQ